MAYPQEPKAVEDTHFARVKARLPPALYALFDEGIVVVAGGALLRDMLGVGKADIDLFCLTDDAAKRIRLLLSDLPGAFSVDRTKEEIKQLHDQVATTWLVPPNSGAYAERIQVVPCRPAWRTERRIKSILESFDINLAQMATNFREVWVTEAFVRGMHRRELVVTRPGYTTTERLERYKRMTGFGIDHNSVPSIYDGGELSEEAKARLEAIYAETKALHAAEKKYVQEALGNQLPPGEDG